MNKRRQTLKPLENKGFFCLSLLYRNGTITHRCVKRSGSPKKTSCWRAAGKPRVFLTTFTAMPCRIKSRKIKPGSPSTLPAKYNTKYNTNRETSSVYADYKLSRTGSSPVTCTRNSKSNGLLFLFCFHPRAAFFGGPFSSPTKKAGQAPGPFSFLTQFPPGRLSSPPKPADGFLG